MPRALLAGCGPMRAREALGLEIGKHISEDCRTPYIRQKAKRGELLNTRTFGEREKCSKYSADEGERQIDKH